MISRPRHYHNRHYHLIHSIYSIHFTKIKVPILRVDFPAFFPLHNLKIPISIITVACPARPGISPSPSGQRLCIAPLYSHCFLGDLAEFSEVPREGTSVLNDLMKISFPWVVFGCKYTQQIVLVGQIWVHTNSSLPISHLPKRSGLPLSTRVRA